MQISKWLTFSCVSHVFVLLFFILSFSHTSTMFVLENTTEHDVISAIILGDTADSKLINSPAAQIEQPTLQDNREIPKIKSQTVAIPIADKNKKDLNLKKQNDLIAKDLLADFAKLNEKQKKIQNKKSILEKALKNQSELTLRQQLLDEKIKLEAAKERRTQGIVNKYKALILQAISENWIVPTQVDKKLICTVMIQLAPGGVVLDVQVTHTSGNPSLDSSVRAAVLKASPLPVPKDSDEFQVFRQFILKVKPENIKSELS